MRNWRGRFMTGYCYQHTDQTKYESSSWKSMSRDERDEAIHVAAENGRLDDLVMELNRGVDVDLLGWFGYTPLCNASEKGQRDCVDERRGCEPRRAC